MPKDNIFRCTAVGDINTDFIDANLEKIDWASLSKNKNLTPHLMKKYSNMLNWKIISKLQKLDELTIREFENFVSWNDISQFQQLSKEFIREFRHKVKWFLISVYQTNILDIDFLIEFKNEISWSSLCKHKKLSENDIRILKGYVKWDIISSYENLSYEFIDEFNRKLYWKIISTVKRSEEFIERYEKYVDWDKISKYQQLNESFIEKYEHKINWKIISEHQILSESFIEKFKDKVCWDILILKYTNDSFVYRFSEFYKHGVLYYSKQYSENLIRFKPHLFNFRNLTEYQILSTQFIIDFFDKLDKNMLAKYQILPEEIIRKYADAFDWTEITKYQILSQDFIREFREKINWVEAPKFQKMDEKFIMEFAHKINLENISYIIKITDPALQASINKTNNWLYMDDEYKEKKIEKYYKIIEIDGKKWVQCYKSVRNDYSSIFCKKKYKYDSVGKLYECVCDYNASKTNSFGFGCWTLSEAVNHGKITIGDKYKLLRVHVPIDSICMLKHGKIRSSKMIVVDLIN